MDSQDGKKKTDKNDSRKVIDISERISARLNANNPIEKLKSMKVRLDLEQAKIAIPASLLSIVVVVTLANSSLLQTPSEVQSVQLASEGTTIAPARGIASIPTGTSNNEDDLVRAMSAKSLSQIAAVGRSPSALEKLSLETLEGKYAIRMNDALKISEIEIAANQIEHAIAFDGSFIEQNRAWMPVAFEKSVRVQNAVLESGVHQTFHLVNKLSMPVAKIDVNLDSAGRLLTMKVQPTASASTTSK